MPITGFLSESAMSLKRQQDLGGSNILTCITHGEQKTPSKKPKKVPQQKAMVTKIPLIKSPPPLLVMRKITSLNILRNAWSWRII